MPASPTIGRSPIYAALASELCLQLVSDQQHAAGGEGAALAPASTEVSARKKKSKKVLLSRHSNSDISDGLVMHADCAGQKGICPPSKLGADPGAAALAHSVFTKAWPTRTC